MLSTSVVPRGRVSEPCVTQLMQSVANQVIEFAMLDVCCLIDGWEDHTSRGVSTATFKDNASGSASPIDLQVIEPFTTVIEHTLKGSLYPTFHV